MNSYSTLTYYLVFIGAFVVGSTLINIVINELKIREFKFDRFTLILSTIVLFIIIFFIHYSLIANIKDLPHMIKREYETVTGEALNDSMARTKMTAHPGIRIKDDETGEVDSIRLYYQPGINKGDRFTINYLPNMGIGNVAGEGYFGE